MEIKAIVGKGEKQGIYLSFSNRISYIGQVSAPHFQPFHLPFSGRAMTNKPYYPKLPSYNSKKVRDRSGIVIDFSVPQQYWYSSIIVDNAFEVFIAS